jgi:hypothetical protein
VESRATRHPLIRFKYYYDMLVADDSDNNIVGVGGFCALIMAYDCLLYSDGVWEKLIFYAMLHPGDSVVVTGVLFAKPKGALKVRSVKTLEQLKN